jgi:hypothetical protein
MFPAIFPNTSSPIWRERKAVTARRPTDRDVVPRMVRMVEFADGEMIF